ncbi:MAG: DUF1844 domain-containing protein [Pirellulales bacterium]|nr:DUF1844 domain-containing protein [Pirellulales bacterium]
MPDEKKIVIDEDWKTQVQAEKEAAGKPASAGGPPPSTSTASASPPHPASMPPASFELLITSLATEVLVALGQVPHPATGKAERSPALAKYMIDTLDMLREKTKGNLMPAESQLLESVLHQVRMIYVSSHGEGAAE